MNKIKIGMVLGLVLTVLIMLGTFPMEMVTADTYGVWMPGYDDYSPWGLPDFNQYQPGMNGYCAPTSAADILWYFDSKHETLDYPPPQPSNDMYKLVNSSFYYDGTWHDTGDDHSVDVPPHLIKSLASNKYCRTNYGGTLPGDLFRGIKKWIEDHGYEEDYRVTLVYFPYWSTVYNAVEDEIGVILELSQGVMSLTGHCVTLQGAFKSSRNDSAVLSDPAYNYDYNYTWEQQNNASNVSYDSYKHDSRC